jgi:hypothetical protein
MGDAPDRENTGKERKRKKKFRKRKLGTKTLGGIPCMLHYSSSPSKSHLSQGQVCD